MTIVRNASPLAKSEAPTAAGNAQSRPATVLPVVDVLGVKLHAISEADCIDFVFAELAAGRDGTIITVNLDHVRRYASDPEYRRYNQDATVRVADGMPIIWASRLQGTPLPERVTGSNLIWSLTAAAAAHGRSLFLLGGEPGTADKTAAILKRHYPALKIAGTACPRHGFEHSDDEIHAIVEALAEAQPDIVYIALGSPKQDKMIALLRGRIPAIWWMGVGISFSFVSGTIPRAPQWLQRLGLEWLHRLLQEPRRLFRRYLLDGLPFAAKLFALALWTRLRNGRSSSP